MPDGFSPAKPFSNGSEADFFEENFCLRCTKCKLDELTQEPRARSCPTYRATQRAYIDKDFWPKDGCIMEDQKGRRVCIDFYCDDVKVMYQYQKTFPQKYIGYTIRNLPDGYMALDAQGNVVLRCGDKIRLETMLLVISANKTQPVVAAFPEE